MKVLLICEIFDEKVASQENILAKYFKKHGFDVSLLTSTVDSVFDYIAEKYDRSKEGATYFNGGVKIIRQPYRLNVLNRLKSFRDVRRVLEEEEPDLIFMMDIMPDMVEVVRYKKRNLGCRFVMDYHADYSNSANSFLSLKVLHGIIRKSILNFGRPYIDAIYPITPASADFLHEVYSVPRDRMELLPLGADMDVGKAIAARGEGKALRSELRISEDAFVIFTGGKFSPAKRTELLIEAVRRLDHLAIELIIVGAPNIGEEAYAERLKRAAEGDARIRFAGWLDNSGLFRHMDMADLAVFPASQSIVWVQAVSMGLPLVVGNTGSQDTFYMNVQDNIIELPAPEICVDRIAEIIEQLVSDPARVAQMRQGARRAYAEVLDWDRLIYKVAGISEPILHPPAPTQGDVDG